MFRQNRNSRALQITNGILSLIVVLYTASVSGMNDPMRPPGVIENGRVYVKGVPGYVLNSIFISSGRRSAIINGKKVAVGDWVNKAKVIEIQANGVKISLAGKIKTLTLNPVSIKKPAEASRK